MGFFEERKSKIFIFGVITIIFLVLISGTIFVFKKNMYSPVEKDNIVEAAFVIPGVPYYGTFNHIEGSTLNTFNAIASIVEYWGSPGEADVSEMKKYTSDSEGVIADVVSFFSQKDFSAQVIKLDVADLKKYINPEVRTPLVTFLPISLEQPDELPYYSTLVLIGIDEKREVLIFHNHWLGNNHEISFAELEKLERKMPPDKRNDYVVIQPKNLEEKLRELSQRKSKTYPSRTSIMRNGEQMFAEHAIGSGALELKMSNIALQYFSKAENSPNFEEFFPPFFKMMLYYEKASAFFIENDFDNALIYAQKAVDLNHDLDKPFRDWPGIQVDWHSSSIRGETNEPYYLLGYIYKQKKDFQKAKEHYVKALDISPDNANIKNELAIMEALGE